MPGLAGPALTTARQRPRRLALLAAAALALAAPALSACKNSQSIAAGTHIAPLALTGPVVDKAEIIPAEQEAVLSNRLEQLQAKAGPQFVVVTTPSLNGQSIEDYALALGRGWGVGNSDRDDGVLLVVAPNERRVRIEVGYGLEKTLSDPRCAEIISSAIIPKFKQGNLTGGTLAGADAVIEFLLHHPTVSQGKQAS